MNKNGITHIVRGVRGEQDKEYEIRLANKMKEFNPNFETELVICKPKFKDISSTEARRRINNNEPLKSILHESVIDFIGEK
jgi:phosphopantetheine adenylyltransferase